MKKICKRILLCIVPALLATVTGKAQVEWPFAPQNQSHALWAGYGNYEGFFHAGLDIAKDSGTEVLAVEKGKIVERKFDGSRADFLTITRGVDNDSIALGYVHLNIGFKSPGVRWAVGDIVDKGAVLGTLTRVETRAPHLHFEWDNKQHPDSWSATGAVASDLQGNPIDILSPRTDTYLPTIVYPVRYKRQGGAFFGINADERISTGDTVIQGNTDIITRAYDHFKPYRPPGAAADVLYDISIYKLQFSIKEYKPGNIAEITTKTPILFEGKITDGETPNIDRNTYNKMSEAALTHVWYSNVAPCVSVRKDGDPEKNLAVNWYYLTNLDAENDRIQRRDADYYWDTNGKEGGRWNDEQEDAEHEADSNKNAAFPDGRYVLKIDAQGYGGAADKNTGYDTIFVNNFNEAIHSCSALGAFKDVFCTGDPVYIRGNGFPKNRRFKVYLYKDSDWNDGTFLSVMNPKFVLLTTVTTDANGRIQPFLLWDAYAPNGDPDKGYDIILDYDDDAYYTTSKLGKTVDVLDATPGPYSIIGKKLIIEKSYSDVSCHGKCDGTISITVRNGVPPYYYYWNDLSGYTTYPIRDSLCAGTYVVTVVDSTGCTITDTTIIREPAALVLNCAGTAATCDSCNGTATMVASGGRPPYTYSWPGGTLTGLCAGTYTGYVTDSAGCMDSCTVSIGSIGSIVRDLRGIIHPCDTIIIDTLRHDTLVVNPSFPGPPQPLTINRAYPNPFTDYTNIEMTSATAGNAWVVVQNITGSLVKQYPAQVVKGRNIIRVDGTDLTPGVYFIKITTSNSVAIKLYRR